jgi:hypothetical protein
MTKQEFIWFAETISKTNVQVCLQTKGGKWFECVYRNMKPDEEMETETVYGITLDGGTSIDFDFKSTKRFDNLLKSYVNQYISKYAVKQAQSLDDNGQLVYPKKAEVLNKLKNTDRVNKYYFYTTIYGIGWLCLFNSSKNFKEVNDSLAIQLNEYGIKFKNEFSEAKWVYRFVINQGVEKHNEILNKLKFN